MSEYINKYAQTASAALVGYCQHKGGAMINAMMSYVEANRLQTFITEEILILAAGAFEAEAPMVFTRRIEDRMEILVNMLIARWLYNTGEVNKLDANSAQAVMRTYEKSNQIMARGAEVIAAMERQASNNWGSQQQPAWGSQPQQPSWGSSGNVTPVSNWGSQPQRASSSAWGDDTPVAQSTPVESNNPFDGDDWMGVGKVKEVEYESWGSAPKVVTEPETPAANQVTTPPSGDSTFAQKYYNDHKRDRVSINYSCKSRPFIYNPKYVTRIFTEDSNGDLLDKLIGGSSMKSYEENRMYRQTTRPVVERDQSEQEKLDDIALVNENLQDDAGVVEWKTVKGTVDVKAAATLLSSSKNTSAFLLEETHDVLLEDIGLSEMFREVIKQSTNSSFVKLLAIYFNIRSGKVEGAPEIPDTGVQELNRRLVDELTIAFNGRTAPLLEQFKEPLYPTRENVMELINWIEEDYPGYYEYLDSHSTYLTTQIFGFGDPMEDESFAKLVEAGLVDNPKVTALRENTYDLYVPINADEISMELSTEWNAIDESVFPKFYAMCSKLLEVGANDNVRVTRNIIFSNGLKLRLDKRVFGSSKGPIVSSAGFVW